MSKSYDTEIISVGTELLLGHVTNTDARDISEMLSKIGINVKYHTVVGDNPERLRKCVETAKSRADIIITTGGLGPTCDDLEESVSTADVYVLPLVPVVVDELKLRLPVLGQLVPGVDEREQLRALPQLRGGFGRRGRLRSRLGSRRKLYRLRLRFGSRDKQLRHTEHREQQRRTDQQQRQHDYEPRSFPCFKLQLRSLLLCIRTICIRTK